MMIRMQGPRAEFDRDGRRASKARIDSAAHRDCGDASIIPTNPARLRALDVGTSRRHDDRMNADPESAIPLYFQIQQHLASSIADGTLAPGSQLPTEEE